MFQFIQQEKKNDDIKMKMLINRTISAKSVLTIAKEQKTSLVGCEFDKKLTLIALEIDVRSSFTIKLCFSWWGKKKYMSCQIDDLSFIMVHNCQYWHLNFIELQRYEPN